MLIWETEQDTFDWHLAKLNNSLGQELCPQTAVDERIHPISETKAFCRFHAVFGPFSLENVACDTESTVCPLVRVIFCNNGKKSNSNERIQMKNRTSKAPKSSAKTYFGQSMCSRSANQQHRSLRRYGQLISQRPEKLLLWGNDEAKRQ